MLNLQWHKLEKTPMAPGTLVSYRSVSQWNERGVLIDRPASPGCVYVRWNRSGLQSEELIINLFAWNEQPTEPEDTFTPTGVQE